MSYTLNIFLILFLGWYFFFHIGIEYYFNKHFAKKEFFLEDIYYKSKADLYRNLNDNLDPQKKYIIIAGDSLIEQFPISELLLDLPILNRGIGHDTTQGLLERLDTNINNINISVAFVMIGHNDFKYRSLEQTYEKVTKILSNIRAKKIYFLSILPDINQENNKLVKLLNEKINVFCNNNNFLFIDTYDFFISKNNIINESLYYDGVHLNIKGYIILSHIINNILKKNSEDNT